MELYHKSDVQKRSYLHLHNSSENAALRLHQGEDPIFFLQVIKDKKNGIFLTANNVNGYLYKVL